MYKMYCILKLYVFKINKAFLIKFLILKILKNRIF